MSRLFDDASSQRLLVAASALAHPLTMSCWVYLDDLATGADQAFVGINQSSSSNRMYHIRMDDSGNFAEAAHTTRVAQSSGTLSANTWHHIAGVFVGSADRWVYLDGTGAQNTTNTPGSITTDQIEIGAYDNGGTWAMHTSGRIAEAAVWDVALTSAEIGVLTTGVSPLLVRPASLIFYVPLIRDDDEDLVGGLSMTAENTPSVAPHPPVFYPASPLVAGEVVAAAVGRTPRYGYTLFQTPGVV